MPVIPALALSGPAAPAAPAPATTTAADWGRRNLWLLAIFAPVLIATGVSGLLLPPGLSPMSGAAPYDIFHIICGSLGLAIALGRRARLAQLFNLVFGAIDLYQALAGVWGVFPALQFDLRPADHAVHIVLGLLLVTFGVHRARPASANL
jgi:hypothetical protein